MSEIMPERLTMSVAEAALMLGVSKVQGYRLAQSGELPTLKVGHLYRVPTRVFLAKYGQALGLVEPDHQPDPTPVAA